MKKYLLNRVLRSFFSIIMVMILSVVLIFTLIPLDYVVKANEDIKTAKLKGEDAAKIRTLEVLQTHGYINYVSQVDYCKSVVDDTGSERYRTCVSRLDSNVDKQDYLKKYRDLGWEEVRLEEYSKGNADAVTRDHVTNGDYIMQEGEFFSDDATNPYLYRTTSDGKKVIVTFNNTTYFRKRTNPLVTFWDWFSNLISFDHPNKVENYRQYDAGSKSYIYEEDVYVFEFNFLEKSTNTLKAVEKNTYSENINPYVIVDEDINLSEGTLEITDDKGTEEKDDDEKFEYISAGGLASKTVIETKTVLSIETEKTFTDVNDHSKGGTMSVTFVFTDGTSEVVTTDVASYLVNDIPVYVGSDNYWYIGNTYSKVQYERLYKDWGITSEESKYLVKQELASANISKGGLERGYSIKLDEYGVPALTCAGCEHKYIVYFDNSFPYIHFNFVTFSLGESLYIDKGKDTTNILVDKQGEPVTEKITYPSGEESNGSISSFHTCTYNHTLGTLQKKYFVDNYANCSSKLTESSMMATSFVIGILSTLIAYIIGIPIGVLMARNKDKLFDKIAMIYIIIMFSVPSLAYIYFFKFLGTKLFDLPVNYKYGEVLTYILPVLSLSLSSIASLMMWTRRYIIDQGNSDYVKFARAKGLSESQIFFKHILRNAIVPIAHGIPGSLVGAVAGALITEQIYVVPGTGKLMVGAIQNYDNWVAIGLIFFYTCLGIFSLIAGDVIITLVDPRISFVDTGGRK